MMKLNRSMELTKNEWLSTKNQWGALLTATISMFILPLFFYFVYPPIFSLIDNRINIMSEPYATITSMLNFTLSLIIILLLNKYVYKKSLASLGFFKKNIVKNYAVGGLFGLLAILLVFGLNLVFSTIKVTVTPHMNITAIILFALGFAIQGLTEEVVCRGFVMNIFSSKMGVPIGIVSNSIFFTALHAANPGMQLLPALNIFIFGLVFSLLFYLSDNIWLVGAAHSMWNFFMGIILGVEISGQSMLSSVFITKSVENKTLFNGGSFGFEGGLFTTLTGLVICVLIISLLLKDNSNDSRFNKK